VRSAGGEGLTPERWQQVKDVLTAALELAPGRRAAFLDGACAGDPSLREEVESLLASYEQAASFIETPAIARVEEPEEEDGGELLVGQSIGHYQIEREIGRGGMGVVYLARDTRLGRLVALKMLPRSYTRSRNRLLRFQQEARAASALNHPNVLTIYEIGQEGGVNFIVTEYVEGETIRERVSGGPMQLDEAVDAAIQVASALGAAHAVGVVHRDVKPENIMVRRDGLVKVLDFGLAKLAEKTVGRQSLDPGSSGGARVRTETGMIIGTATYMSPEQARALPVDARTDVWSLGVVLYEMLSGRPPFDGPTTSDVIVSILEREPPPITQFLPGVPDRLQEVLKKSLRKDLGGRYQTAEEMALDLNDLRGELAAEAGQRHTGRRMASSGGHGIALAAEGATSRTAPPVSSAEYIVTQLKRRKRGVLIGGAALLVSLIGMALLGLKFYQGRGGTAAFSRIEKITKLTSSGKVTTAAISPDGRYVVHSVDDGGRQGLWLRQVATSSNVQINPPAEVRYFGATFSPDGGHIYYTAEEKNKSIGVYRLPLLGGAPQKLLERVDSPVSLSPDGREFAFVRIGPERAESSLWVVGADGTGERLLATLNRPEWFYFGVSGGPAWSPDGKFIACTVGGVDDGGTYFTVVGVSAEDGARRALTPHRWRYGGQVAWLPDGGLVLIRDWQVWRLSYPGGELQKVTADTNSYTGVSSAASGEVVTVSFENTSAVWVARGTDAGKAVPITSGRFEGFHGLAWAPDGRLIYTSQGVRGHNLWSISDTGGEKRQLTDARGMNAFPSVPGDGRYIIFVSDRAGVPEVWRVDMDGGNPKQLTEGGMGGAPACSPDGRWVVYASDNTSPGLWKVPVEGGSPVKVTDMIGSRPTFSPDGRLIAGRGRIAPGEGIKIRVVSFDDGRLIKEFDLKPTTLIWGDYKELRWTPDGAGIALIDTRTGVANIWAQPLDGGPEKQLTDFKSEQVFRFAWSHDGKFLALTRGTMTKDVVLISSSK
jgi:eukaryotic-like serine/threonine-protein kinase